MAFSADKLRQGASGNRATDEDYSINKSLRFNDDSESFLSRNTITEGNRKTWTWSGWVKRGELSDYNIFFGSHGTNNAGSPQATDIMFNSGDSLYFRDRYHPSYHYKLVTSRKFRDTSAWYHIVATFDTTNPISSERMRLYVNGVRETVFDSEVQPPLNHTSYINQTGWHTIGKGSESDNLTYTQMPLDGYLADTHFLDGQAVGPDTFGEFNRLGQWVAKTPTFASPSFDDASNSNHKVTVYGNTSPTIGKYGQGFAFDGNGDYLSIPQSHDFDLAATTNFTVECWVYHTDTIGGDRVYVSQTEGTYANSWYFRAVYGGEVNLTAWVGGSNFLSVRTGAGVVTQNNWHHVALVKTGTDYKIYIDGTDETSSGGTDSDTATFHSGELRIGDNGSGQYMTGSIDDIRLSNTARYTENFTPPTARLESDDDTVLLLQGEQMTIAEGKFGDGMVFDSSQNDKVEVNTDFDFGSGDMSISAWVKKTGSFRTWETAYGTHSSHGGFGLATGVNGSDKWHFRFGSNTKTITADATIPQDKWQHIVATVSNGTGKLYVDGDLQSTTVSGVGTFDTGHPSFYLGENRNSPNSLYSLNGSLKEIGIWKGSALSASQIQTLYNKGVPLTATEVEATSIAAYYPLNEVKGSSILDASGKDSVLSFDGTNDSVSVPHHLTSNTFTVSAIINPDTISGAWGTGDTIYSNEDDNTTHTGFGIRRDGEAVSCFINDGSSGGRAMLTSPNFIAAGETYHIVATYDGTNYKLYVDGVLITTQAYSGFVPNTVAPTPYDTTKIGIHSNGTTQYWDGTLREISVYDIALSASQVTELYNSGNGLDAREVQPDNIVGYWKGDKSSGSILEDYNASSAIFDSTSSSRKIDVGDLGATQNKGTISFWMNSSTIENYKNPLHFGNYTGSSSNDGFRFEQKSTMSINAVIGNDTGSYNGLHIGSGLTTNTWYHIAITWNKETLEARSFINGSFSVSITANYIPSNLPSSIIGGGFNYTSTRHYNGEIKEVGFWNGEELSDAQILELYNSTPDKVGNVTSYWKLDNNANDSIGSNSGSVNSGVRFGNAGTINGATWKDVPNGTVHGAAPTPYGKNGFHLDFDPVDEDALKTNTTGRVSLLSNPNYSKFSMSMWINSADVSTRQIFISSYHSGSARWDADVNGGNLKFYFHDGSSFNTPISKGTWTHLVLVNDTSNIQMYVNGTLIGSSSETRKLAWGKAISAYLRPSSTQFPYSGMMKEISAYEIALNADDVETLYNDGNPADANTVEPGNLVGYWKLNEGAGSVAVDSANWSPNEGAYFGGSTNPGQVSALTPGIVSAVTACCWVKTTDSGGMRFAMSGPASFYINRFTSGKFLPIFDGSSGNNSAAEESNVTITDGEWHFLVGSNDGTTTRSYVDGVFQKSYPENISTSDSYRVLIGQESVATNRDYKGNIKDVSVYNTRLSDADILTLYNNGGDATTVGSPLVYLKLDEAYTANTAKDYSGNNRHGTIRNILNRGPNANDGSITGASWTVANLGNDKNGNNNFDLNNLDIEDQMLDTPNNNFCTWHPIANPYSTVTRTQEGNLAVVSSSDQDVYSTVQGSIGVRTGKWYYEYTHPGGHCSSNYGHNWYEGWNEQQQKYSGDNVFGGSYDILSNQNNTGGAVNASIPGATTTYTNSSISPMDCYYIGAVAVDFDNGSISWYVNNTLAKTITFTVPVSVDMFPSAMPSTTPSGTYPIDTINNFGQDSSFAGNKTAQGNTDDNGYGDFYYEPPSGYLALCTANLDDPAVIPSKHFNTVTYTGDGSAQNITGVGFQPDLVWGKKRSTPNQNNWLIDAVRGAGVWLASDGTGAEGTEPAGSAFASDGFNTNANSLFTYNGGSYVTWNWKANGAGVSNTDGSITSTVSANTTAGFSIVSWTQTTAYNVDTIGHGLSQAPEMIFIKDRNGTTGWRVYHTSTGNAKSTRLNTTDAAYTSSNWNSTTPTSSVFTLGGGDVNEAENSIAYCFHSVDGYSKVGSYTGNGSTDGPFVYTGFRPAYVMVKRTDSAENWVLYDNLRAGYNADNDYVLPNSNVSEYTGYKTIDLTSNGFKLRTTHSDKNASGGNFIYIAFAETPFKYSNAR